MDKKARYVLLLFLVAFLSYANSLHNDFIDVDDTTNITQNRYMKDLSLRGVKRLALPQKPNLYGYYPVTHLSWMACYAVKREFDPFVYRATSVTLHCLATIACFLAVSLMCKSARIGLWTALIFALHPCHTEAVDWINGQRHLWAALFGFLTFYFYLKKIETDRAIFHILALASFILANMSYATVITIPFLLLLYEWWIAEKKVTFKRFSIGNPLYASLPFFSVSLWFVLVPNYLFPQDTTYVLMSKVFQWDIWYKLPALFMKYLGDALLPLSRDMSSVAYLPDRFDIYYFSMIVLCAGLFLICYYLARSQKKMALFGIIAFAVLLAPPIAKIEVPTPYFLRILYLPSFGIYLTLCLLAEPHLRDLPTRSRRMKYAIVLLCVAFLGGLGWVTVNKNKNWYAARTLWSSLLEDYPVRIVALWRLSMMEQDLQKKASFIEDIARNTERCTYGYPALYVRMSFLWHLQLPELYVRMKKPESVVREAYYAWHNADPINAYPLWRLGAYYENAGSLSKAQGEYEKAVKVYDKDQRFWQSLAQIHRKQGNLDKANEVHQEMCRRWPGLIRPSPHPSPPGKDLRARRPN